MPKIYFVGAGPGDPELITVKGHTLLISADVLIYTGSLVNPALVLESPAPVKLDSWGMSLEELIPAMTVPAREGKLVVRLHSGDPSLYGAIVEQMDLLGEQGIETVVVPGVSSMFGAAAALKVQLTLKGVSESVVITRPAGKTLETDRIRELSAHQATMVVFLGTGQLAEVISNVVYPEETPAAVVYHATWPDQKIIRGTVGDIAQKTRAEGIERTALLFIGDAVGQAHTGHRRSVLYS
ncbi:MAG TPA: precorrin-4 C(11)-methyltransferase [Methanoregulaceae archaeon]|nr:precorrin-4 C(11)-methyltransferase [Methanoregulaceae archaeon]